MENETNYDHLFGKRKAMKKIKKTAREQGLSKKEARKKAKKETKGVVRAGLKKTARKMGKRIVGATVLAPVLPFKIIMKKMLGKKGVSTKRMSFPEVIEKFYNTYIAKGKGKDTQHSSYEPIPEGDFSENWVFSYELAPGEEIPDSVIADLAAGVVKAVITFFKNRKDKKQAIIAAGGDPSKEMTTTDKMAADVTEKVEADLDEKMVDDRNVKAGAMKKVIIYVIIAVVVLGALYMFSKKKK
jgi:hypothetical protein